MALGRDIPSEPLVIRSGDLWQYTLQITDGGDHNRDGIIEDPNNPANLDVSGYTFAAQLRPTKKSNTISETITVDASNASTGKLVLTLSPAQTRGLNNPANGRDTETYVWDLQATANNDANNVLTWIEGPVTVNLDVTRP